MAVIKINGFGGLIPRLGDKLLPDVAATECLNAKLFSGELRGWPELDIGNPVHDFADAQVYEFVAKVKNNAGSEFYYGSTVERTSIVPDPVIDESFDRFYVFKPTDPVGVITYAQLILGSTPDDLALPLPTVAPTLAPASGAPDGSTPSEDRVYLFTWQTEWGEETEPSPTSQVTVAFDDTVNITAIEQPPAIPGRNWSKINIYRSVAGTTSVQYYFVASIVPPTAVYNDAELSNYIVYNAVLDAFSNEAPPDGLQGARVHPSGSLVAFLKRKVWFSRPYLPHAWPATFSITVDDDIIGIEVYGTSVVVITGTFIYLIYGQTPGQFGLRKFPFAAPGVSYRSIVPAPNGVYFASVTGLVFVNDAGPKLVTADVIDANEWETEFFDGDLVAVFNNNIYMAWNRATGGFMLDMRDKRTFVTNWSPAVGVGVTGLCMDWYLEEVLVVVDDKVYIWDDATTDPREFTWKSKTFVVAKPTNMGALRVNGDLLGSAQVEIIADGVSRFDEIVDFNQLRRLPSGYKAVDWEVRVTGVDNIQEILIAGTGKELERA